MIGVIAVILIKNGKEKEFEEIAKKLVSAVNLEEKDNLFYRLYKKSSHRYVFLEGYKDKEALNYHTKTSLILSICNNNINKAFNCFE